MLSSILKARHWIAHCVFVLAIGLFRRKARVSKSGISVVTDTAQTSPAVEERLASVRATTISLQRTDDLTALIASARAGDVPFPFEGEHLTRADIAWLLMEDPSTGKGRDDETINNWAHLTKSKRLDLRGADLEGEDLSGLLLCGAMFGEPRPRERWTNDPSAGERAAANLKKANLTECDLRGATFTAANMEDAQLATAKLRNARMVRTRLMRANLDGADLRDANMYEANLEGARLSRCRLEGASLVGTTLCNCDLRWSRFSATSDLAFSKFADPATRIGPRVVDLRWNQVLLNGVDWESVDKLGDVHAAELVEQGKEWPFNDQVRKQDALLRQSDLWGWAARASGQVSVVLRQEGFSERADRYLFQARQLTRQHVLGSTPSWTKWQSRRAELLYLVLEMVAGYGLKPFRIASTYLAVILFFSIPYTAFSTVEAIDSDPMLLLPVLADGSLASRLIDLMVIVGKHWPRAVIESVAAFHGRGILPIDTSAGLWKYVCMAIEGICGMVIESILIATFVQRFFSR